MMQFSLFYFADDGSAGKNRYRLLTEGARFADTHGFTAVWTPERHFHAFGGQYPNAAVTGAAVAALTERVGVRAGSVVAPLHHPLRIAEEWSVVDNLSGGRVAVAFASGWNVTDFALRPENYERRKDAVVEAVQTVRRLWRQEAVAFLDGLGGEVALRSFPPPLQPELPVWVTSAGSPETFATAGRLGAGVLTHLLGQEPEDLARSITLYRAAFGAANPPSAGRGHVTLMLHTQLGPDRDEVREQVRAPFGVYLRSSLGLLARAAAGVSAEFDPARMAPRDVDFLVARAVERYFDTGGLFGTVRDGVATVQRLSALGVDEIACLIDFGVAPDTVLAGLGYLDELRRECAAGGA